ncbi:transporter substrate-binding protein [Paraburkholderia bengalensis]|uniref:Transporter substrate-binding protein n=1 Tax=Paraburkholderia bengalensis TaxID=2747562 RepID=A0ABU8J2Y3_9BURK
MRSVSYEPVKIGVLYSTSGVTGLIESSQQSATLFAADEINRGGGINGREIQLYVRDPGSIKSLQTFIQRAEEKAARQRTIELAKSIIMKTHQLSDDEAYRVLCSHARDNQALIETVAHEVVRAGAL